MSRKTAQKSNLAQIGIFEGKEAKYNKQILEILLKERSLTPWEIAKKIRELNSPISSDKETKSRRIYSVIQRKKGRLQDLNAKGYVRFKGRKWELTLKGIAAVLMLNEKLINSIDPDYLTRNFHLSHKYVKVGPFKVENIGENETTPKFLSDFSKKTGEYMKEGIIDLDKISQDKLSVLVYLGLKKGRYIVVREESRAEGGRYTAIRERKLSLDSSC